MPEAEEGDCIRQGPLTIVSPLRTHHIFLVTRFTEKGSDTSNGTIKEPNMVIGRFSLQVSVSLYQVSSLVIFRKLLPDALLYLIDTPELCLMECLFVRLVGFVLFCAYRLTCMGGKGHR